MNPPGNGSGWYLADLVLEITVEGDSRNVVHINAHLIEASSPDRAHEKAMDLGRSSQHDYPNSEGRPVSIRFRGLKSLVAIHDEMVDGAELFYDERVGLTEEEVRCLVKSREELAEFLPRRTKFDGPNYLPESIAQRLESEGVSRAEFRQGEGTRLDAIPE